MDWFCSPRIDSPAIFASLLDQERGGHFRISPHRARYTTKQLYFPDTAILITRFLTEQGVGEIADFMPVTAGRAPTDDHRLVRLLRCVRGRLTFDVDIAPRFDFGRQPHEARVTEGGFDFQSKDMRLAVHAVREPTDQILATPEIVDGDVHAQVTLEAGMVRGLVLESVPGRAAARHAGRRDRAVVRRHGGVLALLAGPLPVHGPVAGDGGTAPRSR